jgi:catechol 2,3-dioxygenase-like lactoylglutathione lyase family enzyme
MVGFVVTTNPEAAHKFYAEVLGFRLLTDDLFALAFDANGAIKAIHSGSQYGSRLGSRKYLLGGFRIRSEGCHL